MNQKSTVTSSNTIINLITDNIPAMLNVLLSSAGKAIGIKAWSSIFSQSLSEVSTEELYKEISKIVDASLQRETIKQQMGQISSVMKYLIIDYENKKANPSSSVEDKLELLKLMRSKINDAVEQLSRSDLIHQAINEYLTGITFSLAVYKELASVSGKLDKSSDYYMTYKIRMNNYYSKANETINEILTERISKISNVERYSMVVAEEPLVNYQFYDSFTKKPYVFHVISSESIAKKEAEKKRNELIQELKDGSNYLFEALAKIHELSVKENDYYKSKEYGTVTSAIFDDFQITQGLVPIKSIAICHGKIVDSITITYRDGNSYKYGGIGGYKTDVISLENDNVVLMEGDYDADWDGSKNISNLYIKTTQGKTYGPFGYANGTAFKIDITGFTLVSLFGSTKGPRTSPGIASLGVYYMK